MTPTLRLARAYHFAAVRHVDQRRKGAAGEPYTNHLSEVAELVAQATKGSDPDLIIAAVLHDTVEDTATTLDELQHLFGARVAALVAEVTDDKSLPKDERKRLQIEHAAHASHGAQIIKLADKTSNVRALKASPPPWDDARKLAYVEWAGKVVAGCRHASPWLAAEFDEAALALRVLIPA
jgi:GTP diphosphokinase / guanosine-3',5'-bis(diphosphate) 3'-diphosphatase